MIAVAQEDVKKMEVGIRNNLVFKKNIKGILGVLVKVLLNKILFPPIIPLNFGGNENWCRKGIGKNECSISLPSLKLPNKRMILPFILIFSYLNFQTGERKEYS